MRFEHLNTATSRCHHGGAEIDIMDMGAHPTAIGSSFSMANLTENMLMVGWAPMSFILNSGTPWRRALSRWFHIISPQKLIFWRETDRRLFTKIRHTLDIQLWRLNISTYQPISWVWTCERGHPDRWFLERRTDDWKSRRMVTKEQGQDFHE